MVVPIRYQSTVMGSFQSVDLIETFINYQESIKRCIAITYDPQRSAMGGLALKVKPDPSPPPYLHFHAPTHFLGDAK